MSRRKNHLLVPGAREALDKLRNQVADEKAQNTGPTASTTTASVPVYSTTGTTMLNLGANQSGVSPQLSQTQAIRTSPNTSSSNGSIQNLAQSLGIPYQPGNNGEMKAKDAGKLGGQVGGEMVRRLIAAAQQQMTNQQMKTK